MSTSGEQLNGNHDNAYQVIGELLEDSFTSSLRGPDQMEKAKQKAIVRMLRARLIFEGKQEDDGTDPLAVRAYEMARGESGF